MEYIKDISLDVNLVSKKKAVVVKHGDYRSRFLHITVEANGEPVQIDGDTEKVLFRCLPDSGRCIIFSSREPDPGTGRTMVSVDDDGAVSVEIPGSLLAKRGNITCDIRMESNGGAISTESFLIKVISSPDVF